MYIISAKRLSNIIRNALTLLYLQYTVSKTSVKVQRLQDHTQRLECLDQVDGEATTTIGQVEEMGTAAILMMERQMHQRWRVCSSNALDFD